MMRLETSTPKSGDLKARGPATHFRLGDLPKEIILEISTALDPVDAHILRYTCSAFNKILFAHQTLVPAPEDLLDIEHRFAHDSFLKLISAEQGRRQQTGKYCCSMCLCTHSAMFFSKEQLLLPPRARKCLATESKMKLCAHQSFHLRELHDEHRLLTFRGRGSAVEMHITCPHPYCDAPNQSVVVLTHDTISLHHRITLAPPARGVDSEDTRDTCSDYSDICGQAADVALCPHLKVRDSYVMDRVKKIDQDCLYHWCPEDCGLRFEISTVESFHRDSDWRTDLSIVTELMVSVWKAPTMDVIAESDEWLSALGFDVFADMDPWAPYN